jgi:hypothetical protein
MRLLSQVNEALDHLGPSAFRILEISRAEVTETVLAQDETIDQLTEIGLKGAGRRRRKDAHGGCNVQRRLSNLPASAFRSQLSSVLLSLHMRYKNTSIHQYINTSIHQYIIQEYMPTCLREYMNT